MKQNQSSIQLSQQQDEQLNICNDFKSQYTQSLNVFKPFVCKSLTNSVHQYQHQDNSINQTIHTKLISKKLKSFGSISTSNAIQQSAYLINVLQYTKIKKHSSFTQRQDEQKMFLKQLDQWNDQIVPNKIMKRSIKINKIENKTKSSHQKKDIDSQEIKKSEQNVQILKIEQNLTSPSKKHINLKLARRVIVAQKFIHAIPKNDTNHISTPHSIDYNFIDFDDLTLFQSDLNKSLISKSHHFLDPIVFDDLVTLIYNLNEKFSNIVKEAEAFFSLVIHNKSVEWLRVKDETLLQAEVNFIKQQFALKKSLDGKLKHYDTLQLQKLDLILKRLKFFNKFNQSTRLNMIKLSHFISFQPGQTVFKQGDVGDKMYVIIKGSVNVRIKRRKDDGEIEERVVAGLFDGSHFGELAVMVNQDAKSKETYHTKDFQMRSILQVRKYLFAQEVSQMNKYQKTLFGTTLSELQKRNPWINISQWLTKDYSGLINYFQIAKSQYDLNQNVLINTGRQATIECIEATDCLSIDRLDFKDILMTLLQNDLDIKIQTLKKLQMFQHFEPFSLIPLANQLNEVSYKFDEILVKEGQELDTFYIIKTGQAKIVRMCLVIREKQAHNNTIGISQRLQNFQFSQTLIRKQKSNNINYKLGASNLMTEYNLKSIGKNTIEYEKQQQFGKLTSGSTCFGRILTELKLRNEQNISGVSIVSDSHDLVAYQLKPIQLKYLPELLKIHFLAELLLIPEIDDFDLDQESAKQINWEQFKHQLLIETIEQNNPANQNQHYKKF